MRRIVVVLALLLGTTAWSAAGGLANSPAITPATAGSQLFTQDSPGVPDSIEFDDFLGEALAASGS